MLRKLMAVAVGWVGLTLLSSIMLFVADFKYFGSGGVGYYCLIVLLVGAMISTVVLVIGVIVFGTCGAIAHILKR